MVWMTVLLGVHRGGRAKLKALRQISEAIAEQPDRAERLVPVLAVAIRSVRPPEARAGLSAILSAVSARPELEATLARFIPELRLTSIGGATVRVSFAYLGRSRMLESSAGNGRTLSMLPNLAREKVSFDAPLLHPLRFREAISALHDVVINDLRFKPRDKTAYEEWKKQQAAAKQAQYRSELERAKKELATQRGLTPPPPGFEALFERTRKRYWERAV